jgi:hypothetical protein
MLYNLVHNQVLKSTYAIPTSEGGINDLAFENGWRIKAHEVTGKYTVRYLRDKDFNVIADIPHLVIGEQCFAYLTADEWNDLINTMYNEDESLLLCDSTGFTQYIEEQPDEPVDEADEWNLLDETETNDADTYVELGHDYVEEFHFLNQQ